MKKIRNYFVLMMVALFSVTAITSCNDDDDDDPDSPAGGKSELVGTWKAVHEKFVCKHDGKVVEEYDERYEGTLLYEFTSAGTLIITDGSTVVTASYKLSGNKLTVVFDDPYYEDEDYEDEVAEINIKKLSDKVLELELIEKYNDEGFIHEDYTLATFNKIK